MKTIIDGKKYDTKTAYKVGSSKGGDYTEFNPYDAECLYKKKNGEYFICSCNKRIMPRSAEQSRAWAMVNLEADEIEASFGEVEE